MLRQRLMTATVLATVVLLGLFQLRHEAFAIVCAAIFAYASWEWGALAGLNRLIYRLGYVMSCVLLGHLALRLPGMWVALSSCIVWCCLAGLVIVYPRFTRRINTLGILIAGGLILPVAWRCIVAMQPPGQVLYLLTLIIMVAVTDTAAYFIGRLFGKRKLIPKVSPGKTRIGLLGGMSTGLVSGMICTQSFALIEGWSLFGLSLALVCIMAAVVGDLAISMLKRKQHMKDSGRLLPGHGGLLDRIDSLVAALPFFYLGLLLK